jgi:uncharacterized caspase-like protein
LTLSTERRVALVIGNSLYRSVSFLPNPRRDAKAVADALRQTGFQSVELAMDLDRDGMVKALRSFRDQADKADWALIYFGGHGIEINRVNYLVPVDAKLLDDRDVTTDITACAPLTARESFAHQPLPLRSTAMRATHRVDALLSASETGSPTARR